jgi:hypothetical protein
MGAHRNDLARLDLGGRTHDREDLHAIKDVEVLPLALVHLRLQHLDLEDLRGVRRWGRPSLPPQDCEYRQGGDVNVSN